jgi:outer membrane protein assembly factor BamD
MHARTWTCLALAAATAFAGGCQRGFRVNRFPTNDSLFAAGVREFNRGKWGNAIAAFEKLTNELPARDTLLPRSYWYLGHAHSKQKEHLLAAQSFTRLFESFPDDTLSDDGAMQAGLSYRRLWRKPSLDPQYGDLALTTFTTLIGLYPDSEFAEEARRQVTELEQWFATKDYETGMFYFRNKAWDSANIYFEGIVARWPHVPRAREALLRLAESYRTINYRENVQETCAKLRDAYPRDAEVTRVCRGTPAASAVGDSATAVRPPRPTPPGA